MAPLFFSTALRHHRVTCSLCCEPAFPHCPTASTLSSESARPSSHWKKIPFSVRPSSRKFKIRARHVQRGTDTTGSVSDALDWERGSASQAQRTPAPSQHGAVRVPIAIAVAACYDFMLARISWYGCTSEVRLRGLARICSTCPHSWRLSRPRMLDSQYASCCFSGL